MEILKTILWVVQVISALSVIILVLLQHGKGADAGATFGSGSSSSLFGATGSANFLSRSTAIGALIFFVTTLVLVIVSSQGKVGDLGVMANLKANKAVASQVISSAPVKKLKESATQIPD